MSTYKNSNDREVVHSRGNGHRLLFPLHWKSPAQMGACDGFQIRNRHDYEFRAVWSCIGAARKRFGRNWGSHHAGHWQHWKSGNRPRQRRGITRRHYNQPRLLAPESLGHGHPRSATTCASDTGPAQSNQAIQLSLGERACGFDHGSSPSTAAPRTPQRPRAPPRRVQSSLLFGVGECVLERENDCYWRCMAYCEK